MTEEKHLSKDFARALKLFGIRGSSTEGLEFLLSDTDDPEIRTAIREELVRRANQPETR